MIDSNKVILIKDNLTLGFIREFTMKVDSKNLAVYAEAVNTTGVQNTFIVEKIDPVDGKLLIYLKELNLSNIDKH